jgi:hypothetical protein
MDDAEKYKRRRMGIGFKFYEDTGTAQAFRTGCGEGLVA